jgi:hypothetical protein
MSLSPALLCVVTMISVLESQRYVLSWRRTLLYVRHHQGAASFVKKTVFGLSDSVTKVTSSIGKGT